MGEGDAEDTEEWEQQVAIATDPLERFHKRLIGELDKQNGAFAWWTGFSDWKTLALIADYLIQSVSGAAEALRSAAFSAQSHREATETESAAIWAAWKAVRESGETNPHLFFAAMPRGGEWRRRVLTITQSAEHTFFHLGQALDRIAAAVIMVGGFEFNDVVRADWGSVTSLAEELSEPEPRRRPRVEAPETLGRQIQLALFEPVYRSPDSGPEDWLDWMRDTRNAMTHRSPATKLGLQVGDRVVRLFYRQPKWSELQSLIYGSPITKHPFLGAFILRASEDVLDGMCDSVAKLSEAIARAMVSAWDARKANPAAIVQHGCQWRTVRPLEELSRFEGYGADLSEQLSADTVVMNPLDGRRWTAARVLDDRAAEWMT